MASDEHRRHFEEILRGAVLTFGLTAFGALLNFVFSILLARLLGADGSGLFFLALSMTAITYVVASLGLPIAVLRFASASAASRNWPAIAGLHQLSQKHIALAGIVLTALFVAAAPWLGRVVFEEPGLSAPLRWMALSFVPGAMILYYKELFRALHHIAATNIAHNVALYGLCVCLILAANRFFPLSVATSGMIYCAAATLVWLGCWLYWQRVKAVCGIPAQGSYDRQQLIRTSMPLMWGTILYMALYWIDTLALALFADAEAVGLYNAAFRTILLFTLLEGAMASLGAPKFSALYEQGSLEILGKVARRSTVMLTAAAAVVCLALMGFAEYILLIFGQEFTEAAPALRILAAGFFLSAVTSNGSNILMMAGKERVYRRNMMMATSASILLNVILVPQWGIVGAACAGASGFALRNILSTVSVYRQLGIHTLPKF